MVSILPWIILPAEIAWQILINFPPTPEQIHFGVAGPTTLWVVRILSLTMLVGATYFFSYLVSAKVKKFYWLFVISSPVFSLMWMSYPQEVLVIFAVSLLVFFVGKSQRKPAHIALIGAIAVIILNLGVFKQKPKIIEIISLRQPQNEVVLRFNAEDNLNPKIEVPTSLRRIAYNKYFIAFKNSANESLNFFDPETVFFQEVHPMGQKSFVIFFWPTIFLFSAGAWAIMAKKSPHDKKFLALFLPAFAYFLTTDYTTDRRLILLLWPLSIIVAWGTSYLLEKRATVAKVFTITILVLITYGWGVNQFDRYSRPQYWLDNRPIAYDFFFTHLKEDVEKYDEILVPDTLYLTKTYCPYYLESCSSFTLKNFDLSRESPQPGTLYIGFTGNFLGPKAMNSFPENPEEEIKKKGVEILRHTRLLNNIADGYGQDLWITRAKK